MVPVPMPESLYWWIRCGLHRGAVCCPPESINPPARALPADCPFAELPGGSFAAPEKPPVNPGFEPCIHVIKGATVLFNEIRRCWVLSGIYCKQNVSYLMKSLLTFRGQEIEKGHGATSEISVEGSCLHTGVCVKQKEVGITLLIQRHEKQRKFTSYSYKY